METIKLILLFSVFIFTNLIYSQVICVNPDPLSPAEGYQSVDPPTILIKPVELTQYCTAYGMMVFNNSPCGVSGLYQQFIWGTDSFYTLKNFEWNNLINNQTYYWGVRTYYGTMTWTGCRQITKLPAAYSPVVLVSPINGAVGVSLRPILDWNSIGCTSYRIRIYSHPNLQQIVLDTLITSGYQVPQGLLSGGTTYWWRVKGYGVNGEAPYSDVWCFTTIPGVPSVPILVYPPNGGVVTTLTPTLIWDTVLSALSHRVQVSLSPAFTEFIINTVVIPSSYKIPEGALQNMSTYYWRVNASNNLGASAWSAVWNFTTSIVGVKNYSSEIPNEFELYNNYPNPFNPSTDIRFDIPVNAKVKLTIYDINGKVVNIPIDNYFSPGKYEIKWEAKDISSGVYYYRLETDNYSETKKMILIK